MKRILLALLVLVFTLGVFAAADLNGKWRITTQSPMGERSSDMSIVQESEKIEVTISSQRGDQVFQGSVKGDEVSWSGTRRTPNGDEFTVTYRGRIEGNAMKGTVEMGGRGSFDWKAERVEK